MLIHPGPPQPRAISGARQHVSMSRLRRSAFGAALAVAVAAPGLLLAACATTKTGAPATLAPGGSTFTGGTLPKKLHTIVKSGTLTKGSSATTTAG
jgi:hypothetical protein